MREEDRKGQEEEPQEAGGRGTGWVQVVKVRRFWRDAPAAVFLVIIIYIRGRLAEAGVASPQVLERLLLPSQCWGAPAANTRRLS